MLKKLVEIEKIRNKSIVKGVKMLEDLKSPIEREKLLVIKKDKVFWHILSKLRKFHFSLFFDFCSEGKKVADLLNGMDIVFLLGTNGCGKSTTIQYLGGA